MAITTGMFCQYHSNNIEGYSKYGCQQCFGSLSYRGYSIPYIENLSRHYREQNSQYFTTTVSNLGIAKPLTDCTLDASNQKPVEENKSVRDIVNYFYHK